MNSPVFRNPTTAPLSTSARAQLLNGYSEASTQQRSHMASEPKPESYRNISDLSFHGFHTCAP
jgi:hypothetical protein